MVSDNSTLPSDAISEVISHLNLDTDILTLRALSMSCFALLEPSQRKLFSRLEILVASSSYDNPLPLFFSVNRIFNTSPHLATYVRHLAVTFEKPCPETSFVIAFLKKLSSILSLQIRHGRWDLYSMVYPQWPQFVSAILHPSLQRLDLWGDGVLPKAVWQFPALRFIKLGTWEIENIDSDEGLPSLMRCLAMSWSNDDPLGRLRSFLRISPLLNYLKVTESHSMSFSYHFTTNKKDLITSV